jgi:hypothetical protein
MAALTALLHTENDALRLGRCLETLYPCDDVVVVDHNSFDGTRDLARAYGARVVAALPRVASPAERFDYYLRLAQSVGSTASTGSSPVWILCLDPRESVSESLAASLYEWKSESSAAENSRSAQAFSFFVREETIQGWIDNPSAQTRLVPGDWRRWHGHFPLNDPSAVVLEGELLRFVFP